MVRTDEQLMAAVAAGDRGCLEELVRRHHAPMFGFFYRSLAGDRATAADLVQETFIRLLRTASFEADRPFRPWLYAIAANLVRDHLRSAGRRPAEFGEQLLAAIDPGPGPEAIALGADTARQVGAAIASLPEEYRVTLVMRFGAELSLAEIAAALEIPIGTVKSRLSVGTRRLRDALEGIR